MGDDFEDLYGLSDMDDDEIRELIRQQLEEHTRIDPDEIDVDVTDGRVRLSGRVGSEQDYQAIEHVLTDLVGLRAVSVR